MLAYWLAPFELNGEHGVSSRLQFQGRIYLPNKLILDVFHIRIGSNKKKISYYYDFEKPM
jgi:hypothetical protein